MTGATWPRPTPATSAPRTSSPRTTVSANVPGRTPPYPTRPCPTSTRATTHPPRPESLPRSRTSSSTPWPGRDAAGSPPLRIFPGRRPAGAPPAGSVPVTPPPTPPSATWLRELTFGLLAVAVAGALIYAGAALLSADATADAVRSGLILVLAALTVAAAARLLGRLTARNVAGAVLTLAVIVGDRPDHRRGGTGVDPAGGRGRRRAHRRRGRAAARRGTRWPPARLRCRAHPHRHPDRRRRPAGRHRPRGSRPAGLAGRHLDVRRQAGRGRRPVRLAARPRPPC